MARAPIGRHSCVTGIRDSANNNEIPIRYTNDVRQNSPEELIGAGCMTDEDMVIIRDPVSGDWLIEDYAGEAVLFHLPRDCSSDEVRRAAALYAAAFKAGLSREGSLLAPRAVSAEEFPWTSPVRPQWV